MSCYHPLKGFIVGIKDNGKKDIKIRSYEVDHIELLPNGNYIDRPDRNCAPVGKPYYEFDTIPCGRCIGCRLQRRKQWSDRAVLELPYHKSNLFITLTYNNDNIPISEGIDYDGTYVKSFTLVKKDLQDFWKNLRYRFPNIRYLACGEYGSNTWRPHYHAIVFGLDLPDLVPFKKNELGDFLYTSETLEKIWKKGYCLVGEATHESIGYVAGYVTKKKYGQEAKLYESLNICPEFLTMSRRPGLARQYYEDHKEDLFKETKYFFPTRDGVGSAYPSRYFNDLFEHDFDLTDVQLRKEALKKEYNDKIAMKLEKSSFDFLDSLIAEEYNKINQVKTLNARGKI